MFGNPQRFQGPISSNGKKNELLGAAVSLNPPHELAIYFGYNHPEYDHDFTKANVSNRLLELNRSRGNGVLG